MHKKLMHKDSGLLVDHAYKFTPPQSKEKIPLVSARDAARLKYFGSRLNKQRHEFCTALREDSSFCFNGDIWETYYYEGTPYYYRASDHFSMVCRI